MLFPINRCLETNLNALVVELATVEIEDRLTLIVGFEGEDWDRLVLDGNFPEQTVGVEELDHIPIGNQFCSCRRL